MHTKFLWRNVQENIQLLVRLRRWDRKEIGILRNEGLDGIGSGICPKLNLSILASLLMCIFAQICDQYFPAFHDFWLSPLNFWRRNYYFFFILSHLLTYSTVQSPS